MGRSIKPDICRPHYIYIFLISRLHVCIATDKKSPQSQKAPSKYYGDLYIQRAKGRKEEEKKKRFNSFRKKKKKVTEEVTTVAVVHVCMMQEIKEGNQTIDLVPSGWQ